jgi:hypothetical protein
MAIPKHKTATSFLAAASSCVLANVRQPQFESSLFADDFDR